MSLAKVSDTANLPTPLELTESWCITLEKNKWRHPGGKLRETGAQNLDESELLAILISTGTKGRPAQTIAQDLLRQFGSLAGLANQPLERLLSIKGLGAVKPLQSRGDFGPRDICMKIWAFPIPDYNGHAENHKRLASLGVDCSFAAERLLGSLPPKLREGSLGRLRGLVREALAKQLEEIDEITRGIL